MVVFRNNAVGKKSIYSTGNLAADVDDLADTLTYRHGGSRGKTWSRALKGMAVHMSARQAAKLANDPDVALVEQDGVVHADTTQTTATWGLDRIDQTNLPLSTDYSYANSGTGVTAFVIDTGIRITHQEFGSRATWGTNTTDTTNTDCNGHGTHVSGTIGGTTYGVAKNVKLVAVKVLDCTGSGSWSGVIAGIDWVTSHKTSNSVANMSLGGSYSAAINTAVSNSIAAGIVYAVAAGNDSTTTVNADACLASPASTPNAITVGATDTTDARSYFSDIGTCLDIFAPGRNISSAWNTNDTATNTISGTSMATPHVTGAAALYLSSYPGATPAQVTTALTQNASVNKVTNAGTGSPNKLLYTTITPPDLMPPTVILDTPTTNSTLMGITTLSATANDNIGVTKVEFYANTSLLGTFTTAPYNLNWNSQLLANGTYNLTAKASDAGGNATFSIPASVTVANTVTACTTISQQIIDGDFESGSTSWVQTNVIWNLGAAKAYGGSWLAWLGGYGVTSVDNLYQSVTIPANACSANFSFRIKITTTETTKTATNDTISVNVTNSSGVVLRKLATYSNLNKSTGYVLKNFNLLAYKGQTIRLQLRSIENSSRATNFFIDNVSLN
ncbi:S8 family serine peptidase [Methylobacter sp. S3L5C]|uniref:S8 family serine peptidase n=1 Tax=Methylobacter sp. S3L5C TaxID=2839024 RepID=UPI00211130F6|nr:S8 family serine peptidase [Methylobacter sp. S3L5C]